LKKRARPHRRVSPRVWALCLAVAAGCSGPARPPLKKMPEGKQFSGFLSDYSRLKPSPKSEGALLYVLTGTTRNIHQYTGIIVDPVEIYLATGADPSKLPDQGRTALAEYFRKAVTQSVSGAFPVVQKPGALVLRLRSALIGVDIGDDVPAADRAADPGAALDHKINIGRVGVEMELVDAETGEQLAAAVDRQPLGDGVIFGSLNFSRDENFRAAHHALDGWAERIRRFLDTANDTSQPPGDPPRRAK